MMFHKSTVSHLIFYPWWSEWAAPVSEVRAAQRQRLKLFVQIHKRVRLEVRWGEDNSGHVCGCQTVVGWTNLDSSWSFVFWRQKAATESIPAQAVVSSTNAGPTGWLTLRAVSVCAGSVCAGSVDHTLCWWGPLLMWDSHEWTCTLRF